MDQVERYVNAQSFTLSNAEVLDAERWEEMKLRKAEEAAEQKRTKYHDDNTRTWGRPEFKAEYHKLSQAIEKARKDVERFAQRPKDIKGAATPESHPDAYRIVRAAAKTVHDEWQEYFRARMAQLPGGKL